MGEGVVGKVGKEGGVVGRGGDVGRGVVEWVGEVGGMEM